LRTLQRALERVVAKEIFKVGDIWGDGPIGGDTEASGFGGDSRRSGMGFSVESNGSTGSGWCMDTLDRDLIVMLTYTLVRPFRYGLDWHHRP
jgi:hypothetical protein